MRQFGLFQETPPPFKDTKIALHGLDKIKQKREKKWAMKHAKYIHKWHAIIAEIEDPNYNPPLERPFDSEAFNRYLVLLGKVSCLYLHPTAFDPEDIGEGEYPDDAQMTQLVYNRHTREGRNTDFAPVLRYVREELTKQVDAAEATLNSPPGSERTLRAFVECSKKWACGLGALLGCRTIDATVLTRWSPTSSAEHQEGTSSA